MNEINALLIRQTWQSKITLKLRNHYDDKQIIQLEKGFLEAQSTSKENIEKFIWFFRHGWVLPKKRAVKLWRRYNQICILIKKSKRTFLYVNIACYLRFSCKSLSPILPSISFSNAKFSHLLLSLLRLSWNSFYFLT